MSSNDSGAPAPTCSLIHAETFASSIPTTAPFIEGEANKALRPLRSSKCAVRLSVVTDVTDATFGTAVMERSMTVPVVVDLWAEWCGPCKTLGPILERVVAETEGAVELVKVDVDSNPQIANAFRAQSIPAVHALAGGKVVDSFIGALPEDEVRAFVQALLPQPSEADLLVAKGDEASLRAAFDLDPGREDIAVALGSLLVEQGNADEALAILARFPE